jgi:hypothetical protein
MPIHAAPPPTNSLLAYLSYIVLALFWAWAFEDDIKARLHAFAPGLDLDMRPKTRAWSSP